MKKCTTSHCRLLTWRGWRLTGAWLGSALLWLALVWTQSPNNIAASHAPRPAQNAAVRFNEIAWMGTAASANDEWLELYNPGPQAVDLTGWRIEAGNGGPDIDLQGQIAPYGYFILERTDDTTLSDVRADQVYGNDGSTWSLGDSSAETLTLSAPGGVLVDQIVGGGAWPGGGNNPDFSMEWNDGAASWATHTGAPRNGLDAVGTPINGTPGYRNSVAAPAADLLVAQQGPPLAYAGASATYTLQVYNRGNITATGVRVTDTLPTGAVAVGVWGGDLVFWESRVLAWDVGALPLTASLRLTVAVQMGTPAPQVNSITATAALTETPTGNNSAVWTTTLRQPVPALHIAKRGPLELRRAQPQSYTLWISNTGLVSALGVVVSDTLPAGIAFVTQTSAFPFDQPAARTLRWRVGTLAPGALIPLTYTVMLDAPASAHLTNRATAWSNNAPAVTATWTSAVQPRVVIYALQPGNYGGQSGEAVALLNQESFAAEVGGWCVDDALQSTTRTCFPADASLPAGQIVWLAQDAAGFTPLWGFAPQWAGAATTMPVALLEGAWPGFTDDGEAACLLDAAGNAVDVLVYGDGSAATGWSGPAVPHPYPGYDNTGQVLYRKLNQSNGAPVPDTDRATDWAQDPDDPYNGRKLRYPGWDLEARFLPLAVGNVASLTLGIAPDNLLNLVSRTLATAQKSILIEGYTFESVPLYQVLEARLQAGVVLTLMLESQPSGGMDNAEKWIAQRLHRPPQSQVYFIGSAPARYRYQHAKFIVVDDRLALISTDNFGESSLPSDLKSNGTMGHRGFAVVTDQPQVIAYLKGLFQADCDPAHHSDVQPYTSAYAPPVAYTPLPPVDWTTYTLAFSDTVTAAGNLLTVMHSPEHSLRNQDALLGLLNRLGPGDTLDVMQLSEPYHWSSADNPRLQALVAAAQRGAQVRLLLDVYYDDPLATNGNTAACFTLNELDLPGLHCRMANVTGLGIHAKLFLAQHGAERWVNLGSLNGTEGSSKLNRELAVQFESAALHARLLEVFEYDWARSLPPMPYRLNLPLVMRVYLPPMEYPLLTEIYINPPAEDTNREWIEIYHPGAQAVSLSGWSLGDALALNDYGDGRMAFPAAATLAPGQVIVAAACATEFAASYGFNPTYEWTECAPEVPNLLPLGAWEGFGVALGNTQDEVLLLNAGGAIVDSAAWGGAARAEVTPYPLAPEEFFPSDATLKRYPPGYDKNDCATDFYISYKPSPGLIGGNRQ